MNLFHTRFVSFISVVGCIHDGKRLGMGYTSKHEIKKQFVTECQQYCRQHLSCTHFEWNKLTSRCYLFDDPSAKYVRDKDWKAGPPECLGGAQGSVFFG